MHRVVGDDGTWPESASLRIRGEPVVHTFTQPGEYPYHDPNFAEQDENGTWHGMVGRIIVVETSASGTNATSLLMQAGRPWDLSKHG
jgi:plastocyanin